jgi:hypothetical protein
MEQAAGRCPVTTFEAAIAQSARLAALSEFLPETGPARPGWRAWLPRFSRRRPHGLEAIPERYRLQFLLLASDAMPGRPEADVAAMAGRLADETRIPKRLLARLPDTDGLDRWFRGECEQITERLGKLVEAEA